MYLPAAVFLVTIFATAIAFSTTTTIAGVCAIWQGFGNSSGGAPMEGVDGNWRCDMCSNINFGKRMSCHRCGGQKPSPEAIQRRLTEMGDTQMVEKRDPTPGRSSHRNSDCLL